MKVKVVSPADPKLLERIEVGWIIPERSPEKIKKMAIDALRREKCSDAEPEKFHRLRENHLTAGTIKNFIPMTCMGAERDKKRRNDAHKSLMSRKERKRQQRQLDQNPYCLHGKMYQGEAASVYSALTGAKLVAIGCLTGPLEGDGEWPGVPDYISATLDYIDIYTGIIVEVKCPQRIHKNWKDQYWTQCQIQMQLARCPILHVFQYIPPMRDQRGRCQMNCMTVNHNWFSKIQAPLANKAKLLPPKFSEKETQQPDDPPGQQSC